MTQEERLREQAQRRTSSFRRERKWNLKKNKRMHTEDKRAICKALVFPSNYYGSKSVFL